MGSSAASPRAGAVVRVRKTRAKLDAVIGKPFFSVFSLDGKNGLVWNPDGPVSLSSLFGRGKGEDGGEGEGEDGGEGEGEEQDGAGAAEGESDDDDDDDNNDGGDGAAEKGDGSKSGGAGAGAGSKRARVAGAAAGAGVVSKKALEIEERTQNPQFLPSSTNAQLRDDNTSQSLTQADIERFKREGRSGADIIRAVAANSKTVRAFARVGLRVLATFARLSMILFLRPGVLLC